MAENSNEIADTVAVTEDDLWALADRKHRQLMLAEGILRKLLDVENQDDWGSGYVSLEDGVFDVRVRLTADEAAYLRTFNDGEADG